MLYINRFLDRLQQLEAKNSRDFTCSMQDAKLLHSDITRLLMAVEDLRAQTEQEQVIQVEVKGETF